MNEDEQPPVEEKDESTPEPEVDSQPAAKTDEGGDLSPSSQSSEAAADNPDGSNEAEENEVEPDITDVISKIGELDQSILSPETVALLQTRAQPESDNPLNEEEVKTLRQLLDKISPLSEEVTQFITDFNKNIDVQGLVNDQDWKKENPAGWAAAARTALTQAFGEKGLERIAIGSVAVLKTLGESGIKWLEDGIKDSDLGRLLDAIVMGADYNSRTSLGGLESAENEKDSVSAQDFFDLFKNPTKAISELEKTTKEIDRYANWSGGSELLDKAKAAPDKEKALEDYLKGMYVAIMIDNPAPYLARKKVSEELAQKLFGKKILSGEVWTRLEELHGGKTGLSSLTKVAS